MAQDARVQEFVKSFQSLHSEVQKVIVGHDDVILSVLIGLFAGGHVLLEGDEHAQDDEIGRAHV